MSATGRGSSARRARLHGVLFVLLLAVATGLLAQLVARLEWRSDWSHAARNSLSEPSRQLVARLTRGAVAVEAFAREGSPVADAITNLVDRYRRAGATIGLQFTNPDLVPDRTRALGVRRDGTLRVVYDGRAELLEWPDEAGLSNLLLRLVRGGERRVLLLEGHGERRADGDANHDLGRFGETLRAAGVPLEGLTLAGRASLPADAALLVIAGPQVALLPGEAAAVGAYVAAGGSLLWLDEPGADAGLDALAAQLGIRRLPGMVVDPATRAYGISDPSFALVSGYPGHAATAGLDAVTLFPQAAALEVVPPEGWSASPLLLTPPSAWNETAPETSPVGLDPASGDRPGPLQLAVALQRPRPDGAGEQRIVVVGDGDFLANAYLGNGGNLALGQRLVNWLVQDDVLIEIPPRGAPDRRLQLGERAATAIGLGFLLLLPSLLLAGGFWQWRRRRHG